MSKANAKPGSLGATTQDAVSIQLHHLTTLDAAQLRALWPEHFCGPPPRRMRRDMLARILTLAVQTPAYGGLSKSAVKTLDQVAANEFGELSEKRPPSADRRLIPGARLIREWHGVTHEVCVTEEGFLWGGASYRSLSAVARAITGTRWNGPAFFGLRSKGDS